MMLLSIDWDAFSGTRELVFDAPIWGTPDRQYDRIEAWHKRVHKRGGSDWSVLEKDFPLFSGWQQLKQYAGIPTQITLSHADAWMWLQEHYELHGKQVVTNIDSHHDLVSLSGDPAKVRPGNWAGLGLQQGLIEAYHCVYPEWHATLPVAEGFDVERTKQEIELLLPEHIHSVIHLTRTAVWPEPATIRGILLVQSPSWCSPAHDWAFQQVGKCLQAQPLIPPLERPYLSPLYSHYVAAK